MERLTLHTHAIALDYVGAQLAEQCGPSLLI
jgi:hypothetical protein